MGVHVHELRPAAVHPHVVVKWLLRRDSTVVTTVISDPSSPPPPNGVGAPVQLVWLSQAPYTGTTGTPISPQPEVAVEDALNNIVTSDLSSVTLQIVSYTGPD